VPAGRTAGIFSDYSTAEKNCKQNLTFSQLLSEKGSNWTKNAKQEVPIQHLLFYVNI
jgi:hypothetical protein